MSADISKYERIYRKAAEKNGHASWMESAISALAVDLEEYTGDKVGVSGPFGLRAAVMLQVGTDFLTITPSFSDGGLQLYYDTGEKAQRVAPLSLGDFNGFNNISECLPGTVEEIVTLFRPEGKRKSAPENTEDLLWDLLFKHRGHNVCIVSYGDSDSPADVCLECEDCGEVILDAGLYTICAKSK